MGRRRYQHPSVFKTKTKRPEYYFRAQVDVLTGANEIGRKERTIYLGLVADIGGKKAAEKLRDEKLKEINNTPVLIQSQVKFSDLAAAYLKTYVPTLTPSTAHNYRHRIGKHVVPAFGDLRLYEMTPERVQHWINAMQNAGQPRSCRRVNLAILRSIFEVAGDWGYFNGRNPCKRVKPGPGEPTTRDLRALEPAEVLRLFAAMNGEQPLLLITKVAYYSGFRIGEVLGLMWGSIDYDGNKIRVTQGKSQQGELSTPKSDAGRREAELGELAKELVRPASASEEDLIWPDAVYTDLQYRLKEAAKQAKVDFKGFGFHTLRRTFATYLETFKPKACPELVKDMGHSNAKMTEHYIRRKNTGVFEYLHNLLYFSGDIREQTVVQ